MSNADNRSSTKIPKQSNNLSKDENELVFNLVGRRCVSLCTTVAQVYLTEPPDCRWLKKATGALCFVKDNAKRSYFCRLYCLIKHRLMWEQEMYDTIDISKSQPYLLTFEGEDGIVALNFAFEDEAENFLSIAMSTVANRNRRREERKKRGPTSIKEPPARPPPIVNNNNNSSKLIDEPVALRNPSNITKLAPAPSPAYQPFNNSKNKKGQAGTRRITKADIGTPSNFKHITHVGWNAKSGFDYTGEDESLKPFLQKAGVSENQLKDRRTRDFIYSFIQSNNVEEVMRNETRTKTTAPPVPTRHQNQNNHQQHHGEKQMRIAPAPPPPPKDFIDSNTRPERRERPPAPPLPQTTPPISTPKVIRNTPTRPPPSNINSQPREIVQNIPPPPPPPMMPPVPPAPPMNIEMPSSGPKLPVVSDNRNALMDAIRKGANLKKVEVSSTTSSSGDSRNDLLSEIRSGVDLRPVGERPQGNRSSGEHGGTDALAEALKKALEIRKTAFGGSSSSESDVDEDDDNEWDD